MGFGIGGDFALDSDYVDEVMPKRWQETMVGITKSFSALGNLSAAGGFLFLCSIEWTCRNLETDLLICGLSLIFNDHQPFILF